MSTTTDDLAREMRPSHLLSMVIAGLPGLALQAILLAYYAGVMTTQLETQQRDMGIVQREISSMRAELAKTREEAARASGRQQ